MSVWSSARSFLDRLSSAQNEAPGHTISVISGKGGVGKTTVSMGLAAAAAANGLSVLAVDIDPQGSLSSCMTDVIPDETVLEALRRGGSLADFALPSEWKGFDGEVDYVFAGRDLITLDGPIDFDRAPLLTSRMGDLSDYDVMIIDGPANLGRLSLEVIAPADSIVVVAEPSLFSLRGADDAVDFISDATSHGLTHPSLVRVVLNDVEESSEEDMYRVREAKRDHKKAVAKTLIPHSKVLYEAAGAGVTAHQWTGSEAAEIAALFEKLLAELTE